MTIQTEEYEIIVNSRKPLNKDLRLKILSVDEALENHNKFSFGEILRLFIAPAVKEI